MCANTSIFRLSDSFAELEIIWLQGASAAEVAAESRVSSPLLSTSHAEFGVPGHAVPWRGKREVCAQNGCGRPRDRQTEYTFASREL